MILKEMTWENIPFNLLYFHSQISNIETDIIETGKFSKSMLMEFSFQLVTMMKNIWKDEWSLRIPLDKEISNRFSSIEVLIRPIRHELTKAFKFWTESSIIDTKISLELAIKETFKLTKLLIQDDTYCNF